MTRANVKLAGASRQGNPVIEFPLVDDRLYISYNLIIFYVFITFLLRRNLKEKVNVMLNYRNVMNGWNDRNGCRIKTMWDKLKTGKH